MTGDAQEFFQFYPETTWLNGTKDDSAEFAKVVQAVCP